MKSKSFLALIVILCVLSAITYFVLYKQQPNDKPDRMGEPLFKDFPLSDVSAITITSRNQDSLQTVKLKREDDQWIVENHFGYPADFKTLSDLVRKLVESKIGRSFIASADSLSRLTLISPDKENVGFDQTATRITFFDKDGNTLAGILIGKNRDASTTGPGGHYIMFADQDTVFLVDQSFRNLDKKPSDWIENELLNIKSDSIETVICIDSDNQSVKYTLKRPEKGKAPEYVDPLGDQKIKKQTVNSLFDALSGLRIDNIAGFAEDISDEKTGFGSTDPLKFHLFNGTVYTLFPGKSLKNNDGKYYLKVEVGFEKTKSPEKESAENESFVTEKIEKTGDLEKSSDAEIASQQESESKTISNEPEPEQIAEAASKQNKNLSRWVYVLSDRKHKSLITDPNKFFEKEEN